MGFMNEADVGLIVFSGVKCYDFKSWKIVLALSTDGEGAATKEEKTKGSKEPEYIHDGLRVYVLFTQSTKCIPEILLLRFTYLVQGVGLLFENK